MLERATAAPRHTRSANTLTSETVRDQMKARLSAKPWPSRTAQDRLVEGGYSAATRAAIQQSTTAPTPKPADPVRARVLRVTGGAR